MEWTNLNAVLEEMGAELVQYLQKELDDNDINATGNLRRSLQHKISSSNVMTELDLSFLPYGHYVLGEGRGPTLVAGKGVVRQKIEQWIKDKPVIPELRTDKNGREYTPTIQQLAFLITRKIHNEGFKAKPGTETIDETVRKLLEKYNKKIEDAISKDVEKDVDLILMEF